MSDRLIDSNYSFNIYRIKKGNKPNIQRIFQGNTLRIETKKTKISLDNSGEVFFDTNRQFLVCIKYVSEQLLIYYQKVGEKVGQLKQIRLPFEPIKLSEDEKNNLIEEAFEVARRVNPTVSKRSFEAVNKIACKYFALDADNNVWLVVSTKSKDVYKLVCFNLVDRKIVSNFFIRGYVSPSVEVNDNYILIFEKSVLGPPRITLYVRQQK
jgi:hypothetical protein